MKMSYLRRNCVFIVLLPMLFISRSALSQESDTAASVQPGKTSLALSYVLNDENIPNRELLKIQEFQASYFDSGYKWRFIFRDDDKKYTVDTVGQGDNKLRKKFDEDGQNNAFWSTLSEPSEVVKKVEGYVLKARNAVESLNPNFTLLERSLIKYKVCSPPKQGSEAKYDNGCKRNAQKEKWSVFVEIVTNIRGKDKKVFKVVTFRDGEPISLTDGSVY